MDQKPVASLLAHIAHSIVTPALKKRFFRPAYVQFPTYLLIYQQAFEIGVVLGHAYREKITTFAKLLCAPRKETGFVELLQELANNRLVGVKTRKLLSTWGWHGKMTGLEVLEEHLERRNQRSLFLASPSKCLPKRHGTMSAVALHTGVGFGSRFPEQTEKLWKNEHEYSLSPERLDAAKARGVIGAVEVMEKDVTLAEKQWELVAKVEAFVSDHHPELLPALRLRLNLD